MPCVAHTHIIYKSFYHHLFILLFFACSAHRIWIEKKVPPTKRPSNTHLFDVDWLWFVVVGANHRSIPLFCRSPCLFHSISGHYRVLLPSCRVLFASAWRCPVASVYISKLWSRLAVVARDIHTHTQTRSKRRVAWLRLAVLSWGFHVARAFHACILNYIL